MYPGTNWFRALNTIIAVRSLTLCCISNTLAALNSGPDDVSLGWSYLHMYLVMLRTCRKVDYKQYCYIVSVKVQFLCLPIGQNRVTCRSTTRHVRQPVRNETFIDRSIIKWMQYACVWTMKFQSSFFKLFTKHLRRSIYPVLVSN
jgi:hypothetical protein